MGEALRRMAMPPAVPGGTVMAVAGLGILVNLGSAALFHRDQAKDLNRRGAYLHLLADAGVSAAAVLAGLGMLLLGWRWLDPALAALVSLVIALTSWSLLRDSFRQAMDAVPAGIDPAAVGDFLAATFQFTLLFLVDCQQYCLEFSNMSLLFLYDVQEHCPNRFIRSKRRHLFIEIDGIELGNDSSSQYLFIEILLLNLLQTQWY